MLAKKALLVRIFAEKHKEKISIAVAEFLGTMCLVFIACMGATGTEFVAGLVSGLAVLVVIHLFGHISGAHVNPVTTICAYIMGKIDLLLAPIYFISQILGAIAGFGLLKCILSEQYVYRTGMTMPSPLMSPTQIFSIEFVITTVLSFANCASMDDRALNDSVAVRFGLIVSVLNFIAVPYTGCSMNPARSFGPALLYNDWDYQWIYWAAPILAACFASCIYKILLYKDISQRSEIAS